MDFEDCFFDTDDYEQTNRILGEGSFGKVYVVRSLEEEKEFAAKIINTRGIFRSNDQKSFLRESLILHKLHHPAIVDFYGINFHSFEDSTKLEPTILTQYYQNGSLKQILDNEKKSIADYNWSPTKKYICLLGIADAMRYLHRAGIIHRDLKPQNVLVDANYYPRVCDFGLSRCFSNSLTNSMQMTMTGKIGTPLYMAPELFDNEEHYGPSVDVYAFAIIAYEIVTGKEPFIEKGKTANFMAICHKVLNGQRPEFIDGVRENMKDLINKCWNHDPKVRPSFESIFEQLSNDFSFSDETLDEDEIHEYLDILKESRKDELQSQEKDKIDQKELGKLKNEVKNLQEKLRENEEEKRAIQTELGKLKIENKVCKYQISQNEEEKKKLQNELDQLKKLDEQKQAPIQKQTSKKIHFLIKICEIQKIRKFDIIGKTNLYLTLRLKSRPINEIRKTKSIRKATNLVWNNEFPFWYIDPNDKLLINMYNEDQKGDVQIMDQLEISINKLPIGKTPYREEIEIKNNNKKVGTLIFEVKEYPPNNQLHHSRSRLRFLLVGDIDVGKTQLLNRFMGYMYDENHCAQIGVDYKVHDIIINNESVKLHFWDSAGGARVANITASYYRNVDAFMMVYSITRRESFELIINRLFNEIKEFVFIDNAFFVLVGNQIDRESDRKVLYEEAEDFALKNGIKFFETSAKDNINTQEPFLYLANTVYEYILNLNI